MKRFLFFSFLVILTALTACGGAGIGGITDSPEGAANEWLQALAKADGLTLDERTCSSQVSALQDGSLLSNLFGPVGQTIRSDKAKVDISTVKVLQTANEGDTARLKVTGRIRAGEGMSVQSQVLEQTWQMTREDGKWRFCGLPPLTAQDLRRIVLQPSDVHTPLDMSVEGGVEVASILLSWGNGGYLPQSTKPQDAVFRVYRSKSGFTYISVAMLFDNSQEAKFALQELKTSMISSSARGGLVWNEVFALGDEAYLMSSEQFSPDIYLWRSRNVLLWVTNGGLESGRGETGRSLADKMQSHVSTDGTPEPLPTPLSTNPPPVPTVPASAPPTAVP